MSVLRNNCHVCCLASMYSAMSHAHNSRTDAQHNHATTKLITGANRESRLLRTSMPSSSLQKFLWSRAAHLTLRALSSFRSRQRHASGSNFDTRSTIPCGGRRTRLYDGAANGTSVVSTGAPIHCSRPSHRNIQQPRTPVVFAFQSVIHSTLICA